MASLKDFLKQHSTVPNSFVDDLFTLYAEDTSQMDPVINLDHGAKWLDAPKSELLNTLKRSYRSGVDFVTRRVPRPSHLKQGGNNYSLVLVTPDAFKRLAMRSRSAKAETVRTYFLAVEAIVLKYRTHLMEGMQLEMQRMARNQRPKDPSDRAGYIYVLKAAEGHDSVYKIGRTKDLSRRLKEYQTGRLDEIDVVFKFRTDNLAQTEACLKALLKPRQLRRFREVYQVDLDIVKELVAGCDGMAGRIKLEHVASKPSHMTGGYFCVTCSE